MARADAAPAALPRKQGLGRPRGPGRRTLRSVCEELRWTGTGSHSRASGGLVPGSPARGQKSPRWSAGRRARLARRARLPKADPRRCAARRSVPFGFAGGRRKGSRRPRVVKNRGAFACSFSVVPAKRAKRARAGTHTPSSLDSARHMGPRFRGDDSAENLSMFATHRANSFSPCRIKVAVSAPSPAARDAAAIAAAACGWP
jgi:hypothetical protein